MNRNSIYKYEKNEAMPRMPRQKRLAETLDTTLEWLQSGEANTDAGKPFDVSLERQLLNDTFNMLNAIGQREAAKRIRKLTQIAEYKKE